jgi:shikimate dehydrogenase
MIRAAVLGSPISHSLSPALHNAAYKILGVEGQYSAIEMTPDRLAEFISSRDDSWTGFSLTMPLKETVIEIAEEVDPLAVQIGGANTLVRTSQGWRASTTDVNGFRSALMAHGVSTGDSSLVIGSGATARAAVAALDGAGRTIYVLHRNSQRCAGIIKAAPLADVHFLDWGATLPAAQVTINTTPAGVADHLVERLPQLPSGLYFESLYNPWPTLMMDTWRNRGGQSIDGLDLLVHQGIDQIALMTGERIDREKFAPLLRNVGLLALNH